MIIISLSRKLVVLYFILIVSCVKGDELRINSSSKIFFSTGVEFSKDSVAKSDFIIEKYKWEDIYQDSNYDIIDISYKESLIFRLECYKKQFSNIEIFSPKMSLFIKRKEIKVGQKVSSIFKSLNELNIVQRAESDQWVIISPQKGMKNFSFR